MKTEKIIKLPKFGDYRGNLSFIEEFSQVPFKILRTYWLYDEFGEQIGVGHAYKKQEEFIVVLSGSVEIEIDTGQRINTYTLNQPNFGLYIPPNLWRRKRSILKNSLVLIVSSTFFDDKDYVRDYLEFKKDKSGI